MSDNQQLTPVEMSDVRLYEFALIGIDNRIAQHKADIKYMQFVRREVLDKLREAYYGRDKHEQDDDAEAMA